MNRKQSSDDESKKPPASTPRSRLTAEQRARLLKSLSEGSAPGSRPASPPASPPRLRFTPSQPVQPKPVQPNPEQLQEWLRKYMPEGSASGSPQASPPASTPPRLRFTPVQPKPVQPKPVQPKPVQPNPEQLQEWLRRYMPRGSTPGSPHASPPASTPPRLRFTPTEPVQPKPAQPKPVRPKPVRPYPLSELLAGSTPGSQQAPSPARNVPTPLSRAIVRQFSQGGTVNLAECRVIGFQETGEVERFLSEERKTYPNNSKSATVTKELSVSNSIARTVTIEADKVTARNAEGGVTLFGFASIHGAVQQQLNQRYSVSMQSSVSISEKTTIAIPPVTVIEHIIQWKLVSLNGLAFLGRSGPSPSSLILAEVPYHVPLRLTYTETVNDVKKS